MRHGLTLVKRERQAGRGNGRPEDRPFLASAVAPIPPTGLGNGSWFVRRAGYLASAALTQASMFSLF